MPENQNPQKLQHRDIIVIGASAGGVEALLKTTSRLPPMGAAIFVVLHTAPERFSRLPAVLGRQSHHMNVLAAEDQMAIEPGNIYVAVPDRHLVLQRDHMRLVRGPLENRNRPSIDALFRSAAKAYGPRVIGVVLSGYLDDGSAGMYSIKRSGGLAIVQDPQEALVPDMPESAIATVSVDYICTVEEMPRLLARLVQQPVELEEEVMAGSQKQDDERVDPKGVLSAYTCPECNGTLWEVEDGKLLRFACRVGHSLSIESMLQDQSDSAERALWAALRALEERADLARRIRRRSRRDHLDEVAEHYSELATSAESHARVLKKLLMENRPMQTRERGEDLAKPA